VQAQNHRSAPQAGAEAQSAATGRDLSHDLQAMPHRRWGRSVALANGLWEHDERPAAFPFHGRESTFDISRLADFEHT